MLTWQFDIHVNVNNDFTCFATLAKSMPLIFFYTHNFGPSPRSRSSVSAHKAVGKIGVHDRDTHHIKSTHLDPNTAHDFYHPCLHPFEKAQPIKLGLFCF